MGFFDDKGSEGKTKEELNRIKKEVKELYTRYLNTYKELTRKVGYRTKLEEFKKNIIKDSTTYFQEKGFEVTHIKGSTYGMEAIADNTKFRLDFEENTGIAISIPATWFEYLSISDKKEKANNFQGTVREGGITVRGKSEVGYKDLLEVKKNIEADISELEEKMKSGYSPELHLVANELDSTFDNINEYLEALNKHLDK
ncbi:hypothetical protein [Planococcus citreus]|uniref:Uncharacterized protein n=1 Tax=Planococcus citreus TaxID=1373 RepID=A0A497YKS9_9BACL|nr:hypothetical protein [Planococcus citreus]RLJ90111.1 hypothetical protein DFR62_0253 [Planococcus citreus]